MMAHKICFSEEIWTIIPKLSLLLLLIWSPAELQKRWSFEGKSEISDPETDNSEIQNYSKILSIAFVLFTAGKLNNKSGPSCCHFILHDASTQ